MTPAERALSIPVVANVRHIGGIPLARGGATRATDIVRSGHLARLEDAGIATLKELGVRTVIDLRTPGELEKTPPADLAGAGISLVVAPVFRYDPAPTGVYTETGYAGYWWLNQYMLEVGGAAYRAVAETIAATDGGVVFHCAEGKDRTGLAAALLLELAGVSRDELLVDYRASVTEEALARRGITGPAAHHRINSPALGLAAALDGMRERWGSAEGYLAAVGVSDATLRALRARLAG